MMSCGFDETVFVCTEDGFKNVDSISQEDRVIGKRNGKEILVEIDEIETDFSYTGKIVDFIINDKPLISVVGNQRVFWFTWDFKTPSMHAHLGRAEELYDFLQEHPKTPVHIPTAYDENYVKIFAENVLVREVVNHRVWGVKNELSNIIVKSGGEALIFSDMG